MGNSPSLKVSIVMPVYNREKYLPKAIESILTQTFEDFEFLIINDGSTDGTSEILSRYRDPRMRIIENRENIGLTKSLNRGLEESRGRYVARQDADDISNASRIEKQVRAFEEDPALGLVGSFFNIIDEWDRTLRTVIVPIEDKEIRGSILDHNPFCHGSTMFRKEAIQKVGGYREFFKYAQDYDLWLRVSEHYRVGNIGEVLYGWRKDKDSISDRKRIEQYQYAMVAITQAAIRRKGLQDDIDRGFLPVPPRVRDLPKGLKHQLINYHLMNMVDSIKTFKIAEALVESGYYIKTRLMLI